MWIAYHTSFTGNKRGKLRRYGLPETVRCQKRDATDLHLKPYGQNPHSSEQRV